MPERLRHTGESRYPGFFIVTPVKTGAGSGMTTLAYIIAEAITLIPYRSIVSR